MTIHCPGCPGYLFQQTPVVAGRVLEGRTVYGCLCCGHTMLELPTASRTDREGTDNHTGPLWSERVVRPEKSAAASGSDPSGALATADDGGAA